MAFNYSPRVITDGLVLYLDAANTRSYPGTGTVWSDLSRGGNNGILTNGPTFSSANGGSIVFDGTNDYINGSVIQPTNLTLCVYFKATGPPSLNDSTGGGLLIDTSQYVGGLGYFLGYDWTNQRIVYLQGSNVAGNYVYSNNNSILQNNISYVNVTFDGTTRKIYINGNLVTTQLNSSAPVYPSTGDKNFQIGRWGYATYERYFTGNIYQASIYNRALSAAEIQQNYNATKTRFGL